MLKQNGIFVEKPKAKPGRVIEQRAFTQKELKKFFTHCPENHKTLFLLMLSTGARPTELVSSNRSSHVPLLKSEVDLKKRIITIRSSKAKPGYKGGIRSVEIQPELGEQINNLMKSHDLKTVFHQILKLSKPFDRILKEAEIEKIDLLGKNSQPTLFDTLLQH